MHNSSEPRHEYSNETIPIGITNWIASFVTTSQPTSANQDVHLRRLGFRKKSEEPTGWRQ